MTQELRRLLDLVEKEMPGLRTELDRVPGGMSTLEHVALKTEADAPIALAVGRAVGELSGSRAEQGDFPAWTDGALLAGFASIPTVILGPGDLQLAHSPREAIEVDQVLDAARLYALAALEFCRVDA